MSKVQFVTNAGALAQRKRLLASEVRGNLRTAAKAHAQKMKNVAEQLSSGTLTPVRRRQLGYPYALRLAPDSAPLPDFIINDITGVFKRSWRTRVQETQRGWTITLFNDAPEAKYLLGTKKARMRPILIQVDKMMAGELPARVRKVARKAARDNAGAGAGPASLWGGIVYAVGVGLASAAGGVEAAL